MWDCRDETGGSGGSGGEGVSDDKVVLSAHERKRARIVHRWCATRKGFRVIRGGLGLVRTFSFLA